MDRHACCGLCERPAAGRLGRRRGRSISMACAASWAGSPAHRSLGWLAGGGCGVTLPMVGSAPVDSPRLMLLARSYARTVAHAPLHERFCRRAPGRARCYSTTTTGQRRASPGGNGGRSCLVAGPRGCRRWGPGDDRARTPVVHGCQLTAIKKRACWRQRRGPRGAHLNVWERPRHCRASPPSIASSLINPVECVRQCPELF
jgi:hypothetical protein